jgi:hypothetical protein
MNEWTGVLARLETPTADGRALATPERLLSRPLPLPLVDLNGQPAGAITALSIHGDEVRAEGTTRNGILTKKRPTRPIALDADQTEIHGQAEGVLFTRWRIIGATLLDPTDTPPWPESQIRLKEDQP